MSSAANLWFGTHADVGNDEGNDVGNDEGSDVANDVANNEGKSKNTFHVRNDNDWKKRSGKMVSRKISERKIRSRESPPSLFET